MPYGLDFGPWGLSLDDSAFGRALCALGVAAGGAGPRPGLTEVLAMASDPHALEPLIATRSPIPWRIKPLLAASPARWAVLSSRHPAAAAAAAWATAVGDGGPERDPRLAIEPFAGAIGAYRYLADQLLQPGVGATPFVAVPELGSPRSWHWPLRIGLFDDAPSRAIRAGLKADARSQSFHRIVDLNDEPAADLVLLPGALSDSLARLTKLPRAIDVGCIAILGGQAGANDVELEAIIGALRLRAHAWGLLVADVPVDSADRWLAALLLQLSHDASLDVGLRAVSDTHGPWVLFAEPRQLERARVTRSASRMATAIASREGTMALLPGSVPLEFGLPAEPTGADLVEAVEDPSVFHGKDDGARATAAMAGTIARDRRERPVRSAPRWIQVDIRPGLDFRGRPRRTSLRPSLVHGVDVWIGPETSGIRASEDFPDVLPHDGTTHQLTVIFAELSGARRTTTGHVRLPPTGSGSRHRFFFETPADGPFRARIIVAHQNRVLQSALLTAPVRAPGAPPERGAGRIRLDVEAALRPGLSELKGRRRYDVAIVHNHDEGGMASGTMVSGNDAVPLELGAITETTNRIVGFLSDAARDPDSYGPTLDAEATVTLLFRLAHQGRLLYDDLLTRPAFKQLVSAAERIQILAADPNAILPLEFVYELPTPARPPALCKNARQALLDGHCADEHHQVDAEGHLDVVCPSGFWAMSRVIERHLADPEGVKKLAGTAYAIDAEPVRDRDVLTGLTGAIFAASARVDEVVPGSSARVEAALASSTGNATRVRTWPDWVTTISQSTPSLLVILAHSARDDLTGLTALEIESDQRRDASEINRTFIGPEGTHPIVFLLGCDTAVAELQYQSFVTRFRQLGSALVVGTIATVAGSHAAGVAASLTTALHDADTSRKPAFGDLLREVRRTLLADGEVMALSLTSYGDADWRFDPGR